MLWRPRSSSCNPAQKLRDAGWDTNRCPRQLQCRGTAPLRSSGKNIDAEMADLHSVGQNSDHATVICDGLRCKHHVLEQKLHLGNSQSTVKLGQLKTGFKNSSTAMMMSSRLVSGSKASTSRSAWHAAVPAARPASRNLGCTVRASAVMEIPREFKKVSNGLSFQATNMSVWRHCIAGGVAWQ